MALPEQLPGRRQPRDAGADHAHLLLRRHHRRGRTWRHEQQQANSKELRLVSSLSTTEFISWRINSQQY
jgi:hypothetical protein